MENWKNKDVVDEKRHLRRGYKADYTILRKKIYLIMQHRKYAQVLCFYLLNNFMSNKKLFAKFYLGK